MEQLSLFTKVRFVVGLAIAAILFGFIVLPLARPEMPGGTLILMQHPHPVPIVMVAVLLAMLTPVVSLLGAPYLRYITALAATPVGLAVLTLMTAGITPILADITIEDREHLFHLMLVDLLLWSGVVWMGILATSLIIKAPIRELLTDTNKADTVRTNKKTAQKNIINTLLGVSGVVVLAYLLLRVLIHSGKVQVVTEYISPPPQKGQIVFGLITAFGLATLGVHQLTALRVEWLLLTVVIVGVGVLIPTGAEDSAIKVLLAPACFPSSQLLKTITPLAWTAFGSIGVLWGYWTSMRLRYARLKLIN
ncbi:MAG: hypothetical protein JW709_12450 [Sedimentisphaerales bacterium]|nr:hypothetical protein [Sedimentisphaerales bacterium]